MTASALTIGDHIELTTDVHSLGTTHRTGDRGTVRKVHADGHLTARMTNGRLQFPHRNEGKPVTVSTR